MHLIDDTLDFSEYEKAPPESARVKPASTYLRDVLARFDGLELEGATLPWSKTHPNIRLRHGEVSIWNGVNGHGKSLMLNQVCAGLIHQGEQVCIASMEMKPAATMMRLCRQVSGNNRPTEELIRAIHAWTDGALWLYDQQGTVRSDRLIAVARYCREKLNVRHFVIDSLMKCGIAGDDYGRQKQFVDELCAHAKDTGQHIHLVTHSRKGATENASPDKFDVAGSADITNQADNVFTVWRNKKKEDALREGLPDDGSPDCILLCSKQRHGEWEGRVSLYFHPASLQYVAVQGRPIPCPILTDDEKVAREERLAMRDA
ncbi:MAG: DnaB-like helicase C-terminal domain-containing protein [Acidobacteriaceae bacterium]